MTPFKDISPDVFMTETTPADELVTPALTIHLPTVRRNVDRILDAIGDPACWRPHLKTTKIPEIWRMLLDAGVDRFKCSTTREMAVLLELAPDVDILLAHHPTPTGLRRLAELQKAHPSSRLSTLVETTEAVAALPDGIGGFVDVDPGMTRTGMSLEDPDAIALVALACGDRWRGVHFYDGHIRDGREGDRRERAHAAYDELLELDASLGGADELITSGTTTFLHALSHARLVGTMRHTVSPGTVVLHDALSAEMEEVDRLGLEPAAVVLAHVVSHPAPDVFTLAAGHKSISADAGDPCCVILGEPGMTPLHPSEEHLPVRVHEGALPERGTVLALVPKHVCPTVNLARQAILLEDGERRATVVPVAAGGHETPRPDTWN